MSNYALHALAHTLVAMSSVQTKLRRTNMPYGMPPIHDHLTVSNQSYTVRLGKSGLKVSKIILGCMSYGSSEWQDWVLPEEEGIKHIKAAYDAGIQTFDTAGVRE